MFETRTVLELLALWPGSGDSAIEAPRPVRPSDREAAARIGRTPAYAAVRAFLADENRCLLTDGEMARAITHPDSTLCGLSLQPAYRDREEIRALVSAIRSRERSLRARIAAEVGRYLPAAQSWRPVRFSFVVASRWSFDAVTVTPPGSDRADPLVLINLTETIGYGSSTEARLETLAHVMAHESFHAALRQREGDLPGWAAYPAGARSPYGHIARVMADEGLAHWIDWRERPGADSIFVAAAPGPREVKAFDQLALACKRLRDRSADFGGRVEVLQMASTGPLWSKYGAISGMFAAYRIESRLGLDSLRAAVEGGPARFLRMYRALATADSTLRPLPADLLPSR